MSALTGIPVDAVLVQDNGHEPSVASLIQLVIGKLEGESAGGAVAAIEKLVALYERVEERRAAGAFAVAMATFQDRCPLIPKNRRAEVKKAGVRIYGYSYAELPEIIKIVKPLLTELKISYSWDSQPEAGDKAQMKYTCTLRHANGHSVSSSFTSPVDSKADLSGSQRSGAALTYGMRQSMIQVLGLTACMPDDTDGISAPPQTISKQQQLDLQTMIADVGADLPRFLKFMGAGRLEDIHQSDLHRAFAALEEKHRKDQKGGDQ